MKRELGLFFLLSTAACAGWTQSTREETFDQFVARIER